MGIGGSLIYFIDRYHDTSPYNREFDWLTQSKPEGVGFYYLDHLTHNVYKGNMDKWFGFYSSIFNFREIRFFDIEGKYTGLFSRALTSPCGRIRIPINEDRGETGQIVSYLKKYKGEGIQHIAVGTERLYDATDEIFDRGIRFMPAPPAAYYDLSKTRVQGHEEPLERMAKHGILIDGEGVVDGGGDRADLLRVHPAQGRRRVRRGELQGAVRVDRAGADQRRRNRGGVNRARTDAHAPASPGAFCCPGGTSHDGTYSEANDINGLAVGVYCYLRVGGVFFGKSDTKGE